MELKDAVLMRHSVRGYTHQPVDRETIRQVLELGTRAVSGVNSQPWEFAVAAGEPLQRLKEYNMAALRSGQEADQVFGELPDIKYLNRSRTIGKALLGAMKIGREDREGRLWWSERGYRFFDAPAVIFVLMPKTFADSFLLDIGCVTQNIILAAADLGLGTCVEEQAVSYQKGAREILGIPEDMRMVPGIAIGYEDPDFAANHVRSDREDVDTITNWCGF